MGCSDYVVQIKEPKTFITSFKQVKLLGNARRSDKKIIFLPQEDDSGSDLLNVLSFKEINFIANILIIQSSITMSSECKLYDLISHKYVGPDNDSEEPLYIDQWNSCSKKFQNNVNLFPHDMSNLQGKTFRVAGFTYKPYVFLDLDTKITPLGRDGIDVRIIEEFCRWLNCSVEIVRDDYQWGEIYENQTSVGVMGNVFEDRADAGISGLFSWYEGYKFLDISNTIIRSGVTCIAPAPRLISRWSMPLLPFSLYVWLAILLTILFGNVALFIANGCSSDKVLLNTFGIILAQPQLNIGSTWRKRSTMAWLILTGLILNNAYGGDLASIFTVRRYEASIDTVNDLAESGLEWGATHDTWALSLTHSSEPLTKQLLTMFRVKPVDELNQRSFSRNMAFLIEKLPAGHYAVGDYLTQEAITNLSIMTEDLYFENTVVMLRKSSPYTEKMKQLIGELHSTGLLLAWETQVALKYMNFKVQLAVQLSRPKVDAKYVEPLGFRHFKGIFIIYVIGASMAAIIFIVEILYDKRFNAKSNIDDD